MDNKDTFISTGLKEEPRKEFSISEVRRPFTLGDVRGFQRQFRQFDQSNKTEGERYIIGENQFYEYLSSGSFWGVERQRGEIPEVLTADGRNGYNDLLLTTYQDWRANLIKNRDTIARVRPEVIRQLGDITQLPNPQTAEGVRKAYATQPTLNDFSAAQYQNGLVEDIVNNDFLHFHGHRLNGYVYGRTKTEMRLYLNPPINDVPRLSQEFIRLANERGIPYQFKLIDFALQRPLPESMKRIDRVIFYTDKTHAAKIVGILEEIKDHHPEWFANRPIPPLTAKIMDGVGAAEEPSAYQNKKFSAPGEDHTSFNSVRAKFLDRLWRGIVRNIIVRNPDLRPRGGRSLRQIFNDFIPQEEKQYIAELWRGNLNPSDEEDYAKRVLESALRKTMVDVVPNFTPETVLPLLQRGTEVLSTEFGIDSDNVAFNKAA